MSAIPGMSWVNVPQRRVYVAMICDRHTDPVPEVFTTEEAAIAYARKVADGWLVEQVGGHDGWLYYASHPTEDDAVWVLAKTLGTPPA